MIEETQERKLALGYVRVSTNLQENEKTQDTQKEAINQYAAKHNLAIIKIFEDLNVSGADLVRPAMDALRLYIKDDKDKVKDIVFYDIDRLGRGEVSIYLERFFTRRGVQVHYVQTPPTGNAISDEIVKGTKQLLAKIERLTIKERFRWGRLSHAKQGSVYLNPYTTPYGYKLVTKKESGQEPKLVIEETEADVVKRIFAMYLKPGGSTVSISDALSKSSSTTRCGRKYWHNSTISRMLQNPTYTGRFHFNKRKHDRFQDDETGKRIIKKTARPKEDIIEIKVPAIVSDEVFRAVQEKLSGVKAKFFSVRNNKGIYVYQSLLKCGECGSPYYTTYSRYKTKKGIATPLYYQCATKATSKKLNPATVKCSNRMISQKDLDKYVWSAVRDRLNERKFFDGLFGDNDGALKRNVKTTTNKIEKLNKDLSALTEKISNAFDELTAGLFPREIVVAKLGEYNKKKLELEGAIREQEEMLHSLERVSVTKGMFTKWRTDFYKKLEKDYREFPPDRDRQSLIRQVVREITIHKDSIEVHGELNISISNLSTVEHTKRNVERKLLIPFYLQVGQRVCA